MEDARENEIVELCQKYGLGRCGLGSIRSFITMAYHHSALPTALPADKHVVFNSAIRFATNRIACRGRHGDSIGMSLVMSRGALALRDEIAADERPEKLRRWRSNVTWEHQDPVLEVIAFAEAPGREVDDVILRLLRHPGVVVTRQEERSIEPRFRNSGDPEERYRQAGIELVQSNTGTFDYFRTLAGRKADGRKGKYHHPFKPF